MLNWETLETACKACTKCALCQTRHNVVFGVGPHDAEVFFIGEGPGEQEDLRGEPFVGPAGKLLDDMLCIIDLGRENCYIGNIVKCRPPHNRDPLQTEQDACIEWLRAQTRLLRPKIIVCLGRIAAMKLIREDFKISANTASGSRRAASGSRRCITRRRFCATRPSGPKPSATSNPLQAKVREVCTHTL